MNEKQYKPSETFESVGFELSQDDILNFVGYFHAKTSFDHLQSSFVDWDVNFRENRSFYLNQKSKKKKINASQTPQRYVEKSEQTVKSSKKSVKPKFQMAKRHHEYQKSEVKSPQQQQQNTLNEVQRQSKEQNRVSLFLPSSIPENSHHASPRRMTLDENPFEEDIQNKEKQKNEQKQEFIDEVPQERTPSEPEITVLPLLDKSSTKRYYYGTNKPKIQILNQFMVEPDPVIQFSGIQNKIQSSQNVYNHRKQKTEHSKASTPVSNVKLQEKQKQKSQSFQIRQNNNFHIQFSQIDIHSKFTSKTRKNEEKKYFKQQTPQRKERKQDESKSRSKSKTKIKQAKDSYIYNQRPKVYRLNLLHSAKQSQIEPIARSSPSPDFNHEPITHLKNPNSSDILQEKRNKQKQKSSKIVHSSKEPIPIEDYDSVFDKQENKHDEEQFNASNADENIDQIEANTPQTFKNMIFHQESQKQKKKNLIQEPQDKPLDYFAIPLYNLQKVKTLESKRPTNQEPEPEPEPEPKPEKIKINIENKPVTESRSHLKQSTGRKRIFSQVQKEQREQKNTVSNDIAQNDEEMRMLLAAKGNKYKETIVKKYIQFKRAEKNQNYSYL